MFFSFFFYFRYYFYFFFCFFFFFSSRRRHTRLTCDWEFRRVLFRSEQRLPKNRRTKHQRERGENQAEQTRKTQRRHRERRQSLDRQADQAVEIPAGAAVRTLRRLRSEERRVGKERRCRWTRCAETVN